MFGDPVPKHSGCFLLIGRHAAVCGLGKSDVASAGSWRASDRQTAQKDKLQQASSQPRLQCLCALTFDKF